MKVRIPGGAKTWMEVLPEQYRKNPAVIVVSVKRGAKTRVATTPDGFRVGLLDTRRGARGLQVIGAGGNYLDHEEVIERHYRVPMADPSYIGPLARISDSLLLDDRMPLLFLREKMGEVYLNLKQFLFYISEPDDGRYEN